MAEPNIRFKKDDGSNYPEWQEIKFNSLYSKVTEKNDLSFGPDKIISVANMYFRKDTGADKLTPEYMRTYNVMRLGDIAFEGNKSKNFAHGRFVENTIGNGIVSHVFDVLRPRTALNLDFWKTLINYEPVMGRILAKCTKSSTMMTSLVADDFLKQTITIPSEEEQQKIADFLNTIDEVIATSEVEAENLELQKNAAMQKIFSQKVRFKKPDGSNFGTWGEKQLGRDAYIRARIGWRNLKADEYVNTGIPMISGMHIRNGQIDWNNVYHITEERFVESPEIALKNGDIIFTKDGSNLGNLAFVKNAPDKVTISGTMMLIRVSEERDGILPEYLLCILQSTYFKKLIAKVKSGGAIPHIFQRDIIDLTFPIPSIDEQQLIAGFFSNFDEAITAAKQELEKWKELKKGLLQQMFV